MQIFNIPVVQIDQGGNQKVIIWGKQYGKISSSITYKFPGDRNLFFPNPTQYAGQDQSLIDIGKCNY